MWYQSFWPIRTTASVDTTFSELPAIASDSCCKRLSERRIRNSRGSIVTIFLGTALAKQTSRRSSRSPRICRRQFFPRVAQCCPEPRAISRALPRVARLLLAELSVKLCPLTSSTPTSKKIQRRRLVLFFFLFLPTSRSLLFVFSSSWLSWTCYVTGGKSTGIRVRRRATSRRSNGESEDFRVVPRRRNER